MAAKRLPEQFISMFIRLLDQLSGEDVRGVLHSKSGSC